MSDAEITIGLATIVVFGVGAQWVGRRRGIPSLLILLPAGLLAGDVFGLVDPVEMFGDLLFPLVTLLVALLLFQSGLQLRLSELPSNARGAVARLVTVGLVVTFVGGSTAAAAFLDVPGELAFMTGAVLVVSGPTVVGPLLRVVRPRPPTGAVLAWEGTTLDPLGATVGVVVLNLILASQRDGLHPTLQMLGRLGLGITVGLVAAALLVAVMSAFLLTDAMEAAVALLFATAAFGVADVLLSEAGLFATVTMGFVVANQRRVSVTRINGFGETLEVLIIGILFILLGALVSLETLRDNAAAIALIVLVLVLVVRPVAAALSLIGSPLSARDRAFAGWMDPRGIVAVAAAAQFAGTLADNGYDTRFLLPVAFGVTLGTGVIYGLTARPVAELLGVTLPQPTGIALVGDDEWLAHFARCLSDAGVDVIRITFAGSTTPGSATGDDAGDVTVASVSLLDSAASMQQVLDDANVAKVVVSASPGMVSRLVEARLIELIGRRHVLRMPHEHLDESGAVAEWISARPFGGAVSRDAIVTHVDNGAVITAVRHPVPEGTVVLAAVTSGGEVDLDPTVAALDEGHRLIGFAVPTN